MRKSTMTGFGQYPDSVFKEQVRTDETSMRSRGSQSQTKSGMNEIEYKLFWGHGGSATSCGEAGAEVGPAQPEWAGPGQCARQGQEYNKNVKSVPPLLKVI